LRRCSLGARVGDEPQDRQHTLMTAPVTGGVRPSSIGDSRRL
jgi:hypothetical protein